MIVLRRLSVLSRRHIAARGGLLAFGVALSLGLGLGLALASVSDRMARKRAAEAVAEALRIGNSLDHARERSRVALRFFAGLPSSHNAQGFARFLRVYDEFSYVGLSKPPSGGAASSADGPRALWLTKRSKESGRTVYARLRSDWPVRALGPGEAFGKSEKGTITVLQTVQGVRTDSPVGGPAWASVEALKPGTSAWLAWGDGRAYLTGVRRLEVSSDKSVAYAVVSGVPRWQIAGWAARGKRIGIGFGVFLGLVAGTVAWVGIARSTRRLRSMNEALEGRVQERTAELQAAERSFRGIFENVPLGLYQCDPQGRFLRVNPTLAATLGFPEPAALIAGLGSLHSVGESREAFLETLRVQGEARATTLATRRDGRPVWLAESARAVRGAGGEIVHIEGAMHDVTAQRELEDQLRRIGATDALTGLPNRRGLEEAIKAAELPVSFVILDLDDFKRFNDTYGHPAGDRALQAVAEAIRQNVREGDTAARSGGEEFVVVLSRTDSNAARDVAEGLRAAVSRCEVLDTRLTVSGGVATATTTGAVREALAAADRALYVAKGAGRDQIVANLVKLA